MKRRCLSFHGQVSRIGGRFCILLGISIMAAIPISARSADNPLGLRAHHVTASVADLPRAIAWYQSILGFKLAQQGSHGDMQFAVLSIPGFDVALVKAHEKIAASTQDNADTPRWVHIVFSAPDPNRLFGELKSRGANPYTHGNDNAGPLKSFLIKDSEGNEIEIVGAEESAHR
jgi:catechol 2,3-dioxygenase-like lactoylglutathione lyase family enzyme